MATPLQCPKCGRVVEAGAVAGLCPACLLQAGLDAVSATTTPFGSGFTAPPLAELAPHFPQLELLEPLGQGGMGAVYKARQTRLDRLVALKILPKSAGQEAAFADRFAREAKALARLSHPNIITIHDYGEAGGWFYFIMEYLDGVNLRQAIKAKTVEPPQALSVVSQVCDALQYAHEEGVVHRDIKPENILLDKRGRVKIADFGLAKLLGQTSVGRPLTQTHQVMGTLGYMAPEQMEGSREVDHRADLYALGVVFYELLTGELPLGRFAPPSQKVQIDVRIDEVVLKTLEKEPGRRYQRASEIKEDVERITHHPVAPAPSPPAPTAEEKPDWWTHAKPVGLTLLALGLIDLFFFFVIYVDMANRFKSVPSSAVPLWLIMIVFDLLGGAGVAIGGVLLLRRRFWHLAVAGAVMSILPLAPMAFLLKPDEPQGLDFSKMLQSAKEQGIPFAPSFEDLQRNAANAGKNVLDALGGMAPTPVYLGKAAYLVLSSSLLGIPAGLWALFVLFRPEVRREFQGTSLSASSGDPRGRNVLLPVALGLIGTILAGLGAGCLVWVTSALYRRDVLREPFYGHYSQTSAVPWLLLGAAHLVPGLIALFYARRLARGPVPARPAFVIIAVGFVSIAGLLAFFVASTFENPHRLGEILGPVILFYSEAYGWIAGFLAGGIAALLMCLGSIRLTRRFWITLFVVLLILLIAVGNYLFFMRAELRPQTPGSYTGTRPHQE